MGFILLSLFSALFAGDVVELEPALDYYSAFNCGAHNDTDRATCQALPYCVYVNTKCYVDPCLKWVADDSVAVDCSTAPSVTGTGTVNCEIADYGSYIEDCTTTTTKSHKYCQYYQKASPPTMDYCTYEYLKSGKASCPAYFCQNGTQSGSNSNYCNAVGTCASQTTCACLTKTYCSLNPGCYVVGDFCVDDTCYQYYDGQGGTACNARNDVHAAGSVEGAYSDPCVTFQVYNGTASSGTTKDMCVNSVKNKAPNKCYELGTGSNVVDNHKTLNCQEYTLPKCTTDLECNAQFSGSGPFGKYYCGDATHSSFSILMHTPSLLLLLLVLFVF